MGSVLWRLAIGLVLAAAAIGVLMQIADHGSSDPTDAACISAGRQLEEGKIDKATESYLTVLSDTSATSGARACANSGLIAVAEFQCEQARALVRSKQNEQAATIYRVLLINPAGGTPSATECGRDGLAEIAARQTTSTSTAPTTTTATNDTSPPVIIMQQPPPEVRVHVESSCTLPITGIRSQPIDTTYVETDECLQVVVMVEVVTDELADAAAARPLATRLAGAADPASTESGSTTTTIEPLTASPSAAPDRTRSEWSDVPKGANRWTEEQFGLPAMPSPAVWAALAFLAFLGVFVINRVLRVAFDTPRVTSLTITDAMNDKTLSPSAEAAFRQYLNLEKVPFMNGMPGGVVMSEAVSSLSKIVPELEPATGLARVALKPLPFTIEATSWRKGLIVRFGGDHPPNKGRMETIHGCPTDHLNIWQSAAAHAAGMAAWDLQNRPWPSKNWKRLREARGVAAVAAVEGTYS